MDVTIYHNTRCSKSRETLALIQQHPQCHITVVDYLNNPPSFAQIQSWLAQIPCSARDIMRTKEAEYLQQNLDAHTLSEQDLIQAMVNTPKLIERPIVVTAKGIVIARPPEKVLDIL